MGFTSVDVKIPLSEIARRSEGRLLGASSTDIIGISSLEEALPGTLSFYSGKSLAELTEIMATTACSALLVRSELAIQPGRVALIQVRDPQRALIELLPLFYLKSTPGPTVHPSAVVDPSAVVAPSASVGPYCVIGARVKVGEGAVLHPHVVIYHDATIGAQAEIHSGAIIREHCQVGPEVVIQNGAVIGSDGFGYIPGPQGLEAVPQVGNVTLAARVEVGANSCIDRATLGQTKVGGGTKIDNLVQVGHNVKIGQNSILCGQVGVAGSVKIGSQVVLGGAAGVADHIKIMDGCRFASKSGVTSDITAPGDYAGFPASPATEWRRQMVALRRLPELLKKLKLSLNE